jgi:NADPH:quinone reductase-like Zn-dependent oxidoreductase
MRTYQLHRARGFEGLELVQQGSEPLRPHEVRIRIRAVSLNYRDVFMARASSAGPAIVPCSDGAGEVVEVG